MRVMTDLQRRIVLDRYAKKLTRDARVGDTIVYKDADGVVMDMVVNVGNLGDLPDTYQVCAETKWEDIAKRVSHGVMECGKDKTILSDMINKEEFLPAGRILHGVNNGHKNTFFNCFVLPFPKDSRRGIMEHRMEASEIMAHGGGVGTNGSTLRPKGEIATTVGGVSSGAVSWLADLSNLTTLIQQGGSRRGAQMIMLNDWHPDVIEFIISKMKSEKLLLKLKEKFSHVPLFMKEIDYRIANMNKDYLTGANISVAISDKFMETLKANGKWELKFPDIASMSKEAKHNYDNEWHKTCDINRYKTKVYHTIDAKDLWSLITTCATYSAEPGVLFIDRANKLGNSQVYGENIVCTNPCGEQPLTADAVCNLGAINLDKFVDRKTGEIDWEGMKRTAHFATKFLDRVINKNYYFRAQNKITALNERRIGLGIMGLHDILIWSGHVYGSPEGNALVEKIMKTIAVEAYKYSAVSYGEANAWYCKDNNDVVCDEILLTRRRIEKHPESFAFKMMEEIVRDTNPPKLPGVQEGFRGFRNTHLLTIAPTGTTGTVVGVSTGIEPYFAFTHYRTGRMGKSILVEAPIVEEIKRIGRFEELEKTLVTSMDLTPEQHISVQAAAQKWVDSSISKTINAPKGYRSEQVATAYELAYEQGCKGTTVYVDGSIDDQVLSVVEEQPDLRGIKQDREMGTDIGDLCPICKEGTIVEHGGCHTCNNCQAQVMCGI